MENHLLDSLHLLAESLRFRFGGDDGLGHRGRVGRGSVGVERTPGRDRIAEPGTHLDRPGQVPLPGCSPGEGEFRLGESDVLTHLDAHDTRSPFGRVAFVVG
ncbi:MAG: hypothetical protein ACK56I_02200, partial [bacterium]